LDGAPIASTSVFVSGNAAFPFKVGWNPAFRTYGPGALNLVELARRLPELRGNVAFLDSCSKPGSWLEKYWTETYPTLTGFIVPRGFSSAAVSHLRTLYKLKDKLAGMRRKEPEDG
jgi:hypothetical protein